MVSLSYSCPPSSPSPTVLLLHARSSALLHTLAEDEAVPRCRRVVELRSSLSETAPRPPQPPCQLHVLRHERNTLGMDSAQVRVLEQVHKERLRRLLQSQDGRGLPPQLTRPTGREVEGDFADLGVSADNKTVQLLTLRLPTRKTGCERSTRTLTTRLKGSLAMSKSVLFWYFRISCSASVPGR